MDITYIYRGDYMTSVKVLCVIGVGTVGIDSKLCGQWLNVFFRGRGLFKES